MAAYTQHFDWFIVSISYWTSALAAFWGVAVLDHDRWRDAPSRDHDTTKKGNFVQWQAAIAVGAGSIWTMVGVACSSAIRYFLLCSKFKHFFDNDKCLHLLSGLALMNTTYYLLHYCTAAFSGDERADPEASLYWGRSHDGV
jgi:hypothetical protein